MKRSASAFALLFLALSSWVGAAPARAALEWDRKEIDLTVHRGKEAEARAVFTFRNRGPKPVNILGITTSCSCTEATPDSSVVRPGESSRVWTIFTVGSRHGLQEKKITLETDDPASPRVVLTLKINIAEPNALPEEIKPSKRS